MTSFTILPDPAAVCLAMADRIVELASEAISERGLFRIALSGGGTPLNVYPLLLEPERRDAIDWSAVEFWWGDERSVPPDHPDSNFGVAYSTFISHLPGVRADRIHRMQAEAADRDAAALALEGEMRDAFGISDRELPILDLVWLGMGPDGHTASLFPGSTAVQVDDRWVVATWAPALETWRMTLTFPVINAARAVLFAVYGENKAAVMTDILAHRSQVPAARIDGEQVEWFVDAAAVGEATED